MPSSLATTFLAIALILAIAGASLSLVGVFCAAGLIWETWVVIQSGKVPPLENGDS